ncbi:ferredoxin [Rhodobacteraceae bacterium HSP-20]|uniref:Ferredoxin n=1 Tax=Paragemmobacter amnigenus TaxID=2852097 RepID=A0ABS6J044_9RHOB|nr:ferredoxin [Rhodobacter amnigenus]MBV4388356.1 ferredoxin [Rhodobacter amnigenus]
MSLTGTLAAHHLAVLGGFHPDADDSTPPGTQTLLLLGPAEPGFWPHVTAQPEWQDGRPDPIDRWSRRTIGRIACDLGAKALFPFGGPPWHPFHAWALRTGRIWDSPVRLLVSADQGLMVSFRGALALKDRIPLPAPATRPCDTCTKPCLTACPADALTGAGYDVPACHSFLDTAAGQPCLSAGCEVRRACPLSQAYARLPEQSAYHMRRFHGVD